MLASFRWHSSSALLLRDLGETERTEKDIMLYKVTFVIAPIDVVEHWKIQISEPTDYGPVAMLVTRDI